MEVDGKSLREYFQLYCTELAKAHNKAIKNKWVWLKYKCSSWLNRSYKHKKGTFANLDYEWLIGGFICPNKDCLKSVQIHQNDFECPYCNVYFEPHKGRKIYKFTYNGEEHDINFYKHILAIFVRCPQCNGEIKYIACPHCGNDIDLFAPYSLKKLEVLRREQ